MNAHKVVHLVIGAVLPLLVHAQELRENTSFDLLRQAGHLQKKDLGSLKTQANGGDLHSQSLLGFAYQYGFATKQNTKNAVKWFTKAAKAGDPTAEVILGRLYSEGMAVAKDDDEAVTWFRRAADTGNPEAQFELAESYANGRGVVADWGQALALYRIAAESGYSPAKCALRVNDPKFRPVQNGVKSPKVIEAPDPEYSEEARQARFQGMVGLWAGVGEDGTIQEVCVRRPLGFGLDEKSLEAVRQWKFEPGTLDGRPVAVSMHVETYFRLY